ncbi:MAG: Cdc6/Cdc18 family protein [Candidatus Woesearchaeota archaeon]
MASIFDDILSEQESLFLNEAALSYEYIPKLLPYREVQQKHIATCISPLFSERMGRNLLVFGPPGVGKTVATKHVLQEIEERTDKIVPLYVNCWKKNTSYKVILELCNLIEYKFTHNKKTDELFDIVAQLLNKFSVVFVFDEIDKAEDLDFLYLILEKIKLKSIILLTNYKDAIMDIDTRIRSRLTPELLEFKPYSLDETTGILKQRIELAFVPKVWESKAFSLIAQKTFELQDIRSGLYLLKESGLLAEEKSSRRIQEVQAQEALTKLEDFKIKSTTDLAQETQNILKLIKLHSPCKIGDLYKEFDKTHRGDMSYKTFTRKIAKLEEGKFISVEKTSGGSQGNTSIITYNANTKTLSDFS